MSDEMYDALADVYDWLVPDALLDPEATVAMCVDVVDQLRPGARVLDCAAGTGTLAVGLALRGFDVVATDASEAMIGRTRSLAVEHGVELPAHVRAWEELRSEEPFDAVFCVGNSLPHAEGQAGRRRALAAMASVLRPGGLFVVTSRNWELERGRGSRVDVPDQLVERDRSRALIVQSWTIADDWDGM